MNPFALIPLRDWLYLGAIAMLLAGAALFVHHERSVGAQREHDAVSAAAVAATASAASETNRRIVATQKVVHDTEISAAQVAADAASAGAARDALRVQLDAYVRRRAVPVDPAASGGGPAAADPDVVLAQLLERAADRAAGLAQLADERGIAGSACERSFDALTP